MINNAYLESIIDSPLLSPYESVPCDRLDCRKNDSGHCLCFLVRDFEGTDGDCTDYRRDDDKCTDCGAQKEYHWPGEYGCRVHG